MPRRSRPRQAPLVSVLVWLCFHLLCASPTPAQGFRAYVTLGRKQNVWWRGIVAAFGGECARVCVPDGEQRCPRTCEGLPSPNGTPFTVVWHSDLVEEKMWLDELAQNTADPTDVVLITKYCSANGGCSSVVPDGGWSLGFEAGDHDGRAYAPLLRLGFRIYFFEYAPDMAWMHSNSTKFASIFGAAEPMLQAQQLNNALVLLPDMDGAGASLGRLFCEQTRAEGNARNIAVFAGNVGHAGCAARLASFEGALNKHCGDRGHGMEYVLHAEFDRATAKALAIDLFLLDSTINAVFSCNDDMAMGAIEAMQMIDDAAGSDRMRTLVVTGCDNVPTSRVFMEPSFAGGSVVAAAPTMLATIDWRDGLLAAVRSVATFDGTVQETGSTDPAVQLTAAASLGKQAFLDACFMEQNNRCPVANAKAIRTRTRLNVAKLCSFKSPQKCPAELQKQLTKAPGSAFDHKEAFSHPALTASYVLCDPSDPWFHFFSTDADARGTDGPAYFGFIGALGGGTIGSIVGHVKDRTGIFYIYFAVPSAFAGLLFGYVGQWTGWLSLVYPCLAEVYIKPFWYSLLMWLVVPAGFGALMFISNFLGYMRTGNVEHRYVKPAVDAGISLLRVLTRTETFDTKVVVVSSWPYAFAFLASYIAGVHMQYRRIPVLHREADEESAYFNLLRSPSFTWPPTCSTIHTQAEDPEGQLKLFFLLMVLDEDKGLSYLSALLGFLVVSRYGALYGQRVAARTAIGGICSSIHAMAIHIRGTILGKQKPQQMSDAYIKYMMAFAGGDDAAREPQWYSPNVQALRSDIYRALVVCFMGVRLTLQEDDHDFEKDKEDMLHMMPDELRSKFTEMVVSVPYVEQKSAMKRFVHVVVAFVQTSNVRLSKLGLIGPNPMEGGALSAQVTQMIGHFNAAIKAMDIFRGKTGFKRPYPHHLSLIGRVVLMVFCQLAAASIACKTHPDAVLFVHAFGVAQFSAFFLTLAYCSLYDTATQLEQPYGEDQTDINLRLYESDLRADICATLEPTSFKNDSESASDQSKSVSAERQSIPASKNEAMPENGPKHAKERMPLTADDTASSRAEKSKLKPKHESTVAHETPTKPPPEPRN